ncbi:MAG: hypothetical protein GQ561_06465 [Calditrichae bacterium]|nr:hypothetical protein [Calditrichia bacterium]
MTIFEIREAYDENYQKMLEIILEMGGEKNIQYHRRNRTPLYQKLQQLQHVEHRLSTMEESLAETA